MIVGTPMRLLRVQSDFILPVIKFGTSNREFVLLHEDVAP